MSHSLKQRQQQQQQQQSHNHRHKHTLPPVGIQVRHIKGDLFNCTPGSLLVHACNCKGSWGAGVALSFKKKYPRHFGIYRDFCAKHASNPAQLVGRALLINPQKSGRGHREHEDWVGCLFTRENPGSSSSSRKNPQQDVKEILDATRRAWASLLRQLREIESQGLKGIAIDNVPGDVVMPKINGGLFKVPWHLTEAVLLEEGAGLVNTRTEFFVYDAAN